MNRAKLQAEIDAAIKDFSEVVISRPLREKIAEHIAKHIEKEGLETVPDIFAEVESAVTEAVQDTMRWLKKDLGIK